MGLMGIECDEKLFEGKESLIQKFLGNNSQIIELNLCDNEIDEYGLIDLFSLLNPDLFTCNL